MNSCTEALLGQRLKAPVRAHSGSNTVVVVVAVVVVIVVAVVVLVGFIFFRSSGCETCLAPLFASMGHCDDASPLVRHDRV